MFAPAARIYKKSKVYISKWMKIVCLVFFIYAGINFALFYSLMQDGNPQIENGRYVLSLHGETTREINQDEYNKYQMYEVRGFSGHWMLFYLLPSFIYLYAIKNNGVDDEVWEDD